MTTIVLATALATTDKDPLTHAVGLAAESGAQLILVHAVEPGEVGALPSPAPLLRRWGRPEDTIPARTLVDAAWDDTVETVLDLIHRANPDLVIAGTEARTGLSRIISASKAEGIANNLTVPSLLFPEGGHTFVDFATGAVALRRILIPIGDADLAESALSAAASLASLAGTPRGIYELLHVGVEPPRIDAPTAPADWKVERTLAAGSIEDAVVQHAESADVVVMATRGHDSARDIVFGSHSERVLQRARCPVLFVPVAVEHGHARAG